MSASERWRLERRLAELERENWHPREELAKAGQEIEGLWKQLEEAPRAARRQVAPHSRGEPKSDLDRPGREAGEEYGRIPRQPLPNRVDEQITVPLPPRCSHCRGAVEREGVASQDQEDIVRRTVVRRFDVAVG